MKPKFGEWQPPETAPKNKGPILADFDYPWPHLAIWNEHDNRWCIASWSSQTMHTGKTDVWFENDQESEHDLKRWMPLPDIWS